jgi:hypothetical protein
MLKQLFEKKVCKKCGKEFRLGKAMSDYCTTCLQKYPAECHMHLTCFYPKCKNITLEHHRFLLTGDIPNYHCEKLGFDFPGTLPDVSKQATEDHKDCPYHTERP